MSHRIARANRRPLRKTLLAALATCVASAALLVGASSALALPSVTGVTFDADSYVAYNTGAVWTVGFTPVTSLAAGNVVAVEFPAATPAPGFDLTNVVAYYGVGFSGGCTNPVTSVNAVPNTVIVELNAGCTLTGGTPSTLLLTAISPGATSYGKAGFAVGTYTSAPFNTPIDVAASPTAGHPDGGQPNSFVISPTASVTYSTMASDGSATSSGTAPSDPSSPYAPAASVSVLPNSGSLTLAGYTFDGWCTTHDASDPTQCTGTHYAPSDTFVISADTTLYSKWTSVPTCTPGTYLAAGSCVQAAPGTFVSNSGATSATPCAPGSFASTEGSKSCTPAPTGSYVATAGATKFTECAAGTYADNAGSASCTSAPAGSFVAAAGAAVATPCAVNTFNAQAGATSCAPCPKGATTFGATGATACVDTTPPKIGTLSVEWATSYSLSTVRSNLGQLELDDAWDLRDIASYKVYELTWPLPKSGNCADVRESDAKRTDTGLVGSILRSYRVFAPDADCVQYEHTVYDKAGNGATARTRVMNVAQVTQTINFSLSLTNMISDFSLSNFNNNAILDLAGAVDVSTTSFTLSGVTTAAIGRRASRPPAQMFRLTTKRIRGGKLRARIALTKAGKAYLAKHPKLSGKRVRMSATFVVKFRNGGAPIHVKRTFKMRLPKLAPHRKHKR